MKDELEQKIAEFYLKEYGSMNHFEYVRNELIEATSEFKKTSEDNYYEETYSFITDIYLPIYIEKLNKGHSSFWSHKAACTSEDFEGYYLSDLYAEIKNINALWAINEIILHCKNNNYTDPIFINYFIYLMENKEGLDISNTFKKSEAYKNSYLESILKGRSTLYASNYASKKAQLDSSDSYCDAYAYAFENAYSVGKSVEYCDIYAEKFGDLVADKIQDLELTLNGEFYYFHLSIIIGEMQAIEFMKSNKVGNGFYSQFVFLFESKYRNLDLKSSITDPIDDEILQKTLAIINKN